ncbi:NLP/P60-family secreted protein [Streptomyces zinciresistens K42]|uniref:NLP/P60-family secreted protein n=1 Tax=Streptomyces zinciresistens K42 TaxID=700597 RepID=G2GLT5_9ACTN|nr:C40 family peptidase [Streptomyces zinciresistens]EGX55533.1 NLP/P60-family secreted protein [Streptomyces zinciresistens K42]
MGSGKRGLITAAVAVVCAVTVVAAPAFAAPSPSPNSPSSPSRPNSPSSPSSPGASAPVPDQELEAVRAKLDGLYDSAAVATDEYNAAEEAARKQSAEIVALAKKIVKGQERLAELKKRAGSAAAAQYRSGGMPPEAHLMLGDDPQGFLDGAGRLLQGQRATRGLLAELTRTQQDLEQYADDASARWRRLEAGRKDRAAARKKIEKRIKAAEEIQSGLRKKERERLAELEEAAAYEAQTEWLDSGVLKDLKTKASAQGRKAVEFATAQLGKPYEWGAEGPGSYDCSGLTSKAWASAGRGIPRTSQEQWKQLKRIPVRDMRPGDLIVYNKDASHIALYIGDGTVIQSPRPGRTVSIAGAGSMPILGVVRPDA